MNMLTPPDINAPAPYNNLRVGLLGGTFDPAHEGHLHISRAAKDWLQLDAIWWVVTPQNPLKTSTPSSSFENRIHAAKELTRGINYIAVSDIEREINSKTSFDTICTLKQSFSKTDFVWITGMDNALNFHQWHRWEDILKEICTAYLPRDNDNIEIPSCPLRTYPNHTHIVPEKPEKYVLSPSTSYWLMHEECIDISSSKIRLT